MKIITVTYADCVEALVVVNDDDVLHKLDELKEANRYPSEVHIQAVMPDSFDAALRYVKEFDA